MAGGLGPPSPAVARGGSPLQPRSQGRPEGPTPPHKHGVLQGEQRPPRLPWRGEGGC